MTYLSSSNSFSIYPWSNSTRLAASMRQLNRDLLTLAMRKFNCLSQRLNLAVLPKTGILRRDSTLWRHRGGFDDGESWTALYDTSKMSLVPHGVVAVIGGVLTHWGDHDAVLEGQTAELKRLEEFWDGNQLGRVDYGGSG